MPVAHVKFASEEAPGTKVTAKTVKEAIAALVDALRAEGVAVPAATNGDASEQRVLKRLLSVAEGHVGLLQLRGRTSGEGWESGS